MQNQQPSKALNIILWVLQVLLAAMFGMAGLTKLSQPADALTAMLPWVADVPLSLVRFIGLSELLGAVGLLLPALLRIKPALTALAAAGITVIMIAAAVFHASRGEITAVPVNLVIGTLAAVVAWGRAKKAPIQARA